MTVSQPPREFDKPLLDKRSYSSPMSFVGATSRTVRIAPQGKHWSVSMAARVGIGLLLLVEYCLLLAWYVIVFGLFGIIVFPWRLHRRSQRKAQHLREAQLALLQRQAGGITG